MFDDTRYPISYSDLKDAFYNPRIDRIAHPIKSMLDKQIREFYERMQLVNDDIDWTDDLKQTYRKIDFLLALLEDRINR